MPCAAWIRRCRCVLRFPVQVGIHAPAPSSSPSPASAILASAMASAAMVAHRTHAAVDVDDAGVQAVPESAEVVGGQDRWGQVAPRVGSRPRAWPGPAPGPRARRVVQRRLGVHDPHLQGAEAWVRPDLPADEGVVGNLAGAHLLAHRGFVLVVGPQDRWHADPGYERMTAARADARPESLPCQYGELAPSARRTGSSFRMPSVGSEQRVLVRHADVHLEGGRWRAQHAGELVREDVVPGRPGALETAGLRRRVDTRGDSQLPRSHELAATARQVRGQCGGVATSRRVELHLVQEDLGRRGAGSEIAQTRDQRRAVTAELTIAVNQEQLVLDTDREVSSWPEGNELSVGLADVNTARPAHDRTPRGTVSPRSGSRRRVDGPARFELVDEVRER